MKVLAINHFNNPISQNSRLQKRTNTVEDTQKDYNPAFYYPLNFKSASDISLRYVYETRAQYLPKRMLNEIKKLIDSGEENLYTLQELHNKVYRRLLQAESLDEVKEHYPEFREVKSAEGLAASRSKAIKAIQDIMPLENFSLSLLKKLYTPTPTDKIVQEYGFTNRNLLSWLMNKNRLNIPKLNGSYIILVKMSNEEENQKAAEITRNALQADPERRERFFQSAAEGHRTPEYAERHSKKIKSFYDRNPERRLRTGRISSRVWELCPEVRTALSDYTRQQSSYVQYVVRLAQSHKKLNEEEKRTLHGFHQRFWDEHPELKKAYSEARKQACREEKEN